MNAVERAQRRADFHYSRVGQDLIDEPGRCRHGASDRRTVDGDPICPLCFVSVNHDVDPGPVLASHWESAR